MRRQPTSIHGRAKRAPALYVLGRVQETDDVATFRLPLPPNLTQLRGWTHAVERRTRRAYFATLTCLCTGVVDLARYAQLGRLVSEVRTASPVHESLQHLLRVFHAMAREDMQAAHLRLPATSLADVVFDVRPDAITGSVASIRWALEWLDTQRIVRASAATIRSMNTASVACMPGDGGTYLPGGAHHRL